MSAVLFVILTVLCTGLILISRSETAEAQDERVSRLSVEEGMVFFQLDKIENETFLMNISAYITNYGQRNSGDIVVRVYAENIFNNIVYQTTTTSMEPIRALKTSEVVLPLDLPDNRSFRLRVLLFEAGQLKISGYGEVYLGDVEAPPHDQGDNETNMSELQLSSAGDWRWDLPGLQMDEDSVVNDGSGSSHGNLMLSDESPPCLISLLLISCVLAVAAISIGTWFSRRRRQWGNRNA